MSRRQSIRVKAGFVAAAVLALVGCGGSDGGSGGVMSCTWESRHSACGGGGWTSWSTQCDEFQPSDYTISPQEHCANMASNDTSCAGSCCIYVEGRASALRNGGC